MYNPKKEKTMKKIYQTPAMEMYKTNLETALLINSIKMINNTEVKAEKDGEVLGNTRRTVNEDGLRDWNIDLW